MIHITVRICFIFCQVETTSNNWKVEQPDELWLSELLSVDCKLLWVEPVYGRIF